MSTKTLQILGTLGGGSSSNVYVQSDEPTDAAVGSIWIDTDADSTEVFPVALPNPYALTFTGAVSATYNGNNAVNVEIPQKREFTTTLLASNWGDTAPFVQSVTVQGITAEDSPVVDLDASGATVDNYGALSESWGCVGRITTGANMITATCFENKPEVDLVVKMMVAR